MDTLNDFQIPSKNGRRRVEGVGFGKLFSISRIEGPGAWHKVQLSSVGLYNLCYSIVVHVFGLRLAFGSDGGSG